MGGQRRGRASHNAEATAQRVSGATYDTGALIAADRNDARLLARHEALLRRGLVPTVPAPVLAQAWRNASRQVGLLRLLRGCHVEQLDEPTAKRVGLLAAQTGHDDVVDLAVAEGALRRGDVVVTSDMSDIERAGLPKHRLERV